MYAHAYVAILNAFISGKLVSRFGLPNRFPCRPAEIKIGDWGKCRVVHRLEPLPPHHSLASRPTIMAFRQSLNMRPGAPHQVSRPIEPMPHRSEHDGRARDNAPRTDAHYNGNDASDSRRDPGSRKRSLSLAIAKYTSESQKKLKLSLETTYIFHLSHNLQ